MAKYFLEQGDQVAATARKVESLEQFALGDPALAAKVIAEVLNQKEIPARLLLGSDAVEIGERYCENRLNEIRQWKSFSIKTDSK